MKKHALLVVALLLVALSPLTTSTVQAEAVFQNDDQLFLPGQFVRVKLPNVMRYDVYAVPTIAVTEGLKGPQVFVVNGEGKAETRAFLDRRIDGVMKFEKVKAKWFNPDRGVPDPRACQIAKQSGLWQPFLE